MAKICFIMTNIIFIGSEQVVIQNHINVISILFILFYHNVVDNMWFMLCAWSFNICDVVFCLAHQLSTLFDCFL